jgi:hypothetical protein
LIEKTAEQDFVADEKQHPPFIKVGDVATINNQGMLSA